MASRQRKSLAVLSLWNGGEMGGIRRQCNRTPNFRNVNGVWLASDGRSPSDTEWTHENEANVYRHDLWGGQSA